MKHNKNVSGKKKGRITMRKSFLVTLAMIVELELEGS